MSRDKPTSGAGCDENVTGSDRVLIDFLAPFHKSEAARLKARVLHKLNGHNVQQVRYHQFESFFRLIFDSSLSRLRKGNKAIGADDQIAHIEAAINRYAADATNKKQLRRHAELLRKLVAYVQDEMINNSMYEHELEDTLTDKTMQKIQDEAPTAFMGIVWDADLSDTYRELVRSVVCSFLATVHSYVYFLAQQGAPQEEAGATADEPEQLSDTDKTAVDAGLVKSIVVVAKGDILAKFNDDHYRSNSSSARYTPSNSRRKSSRSDVSSRRSSRQMPRSSIALTVDIKVQRTPTAWFVGTMVLVGLLGLGVIAAAILCPPTLLVTLPAFGAVTVASVVAVSAAAGATVALSALAVRVATQSTQPIEPANQQATEVKPMPQFRQAAAKVPEGSGDNVSPPKRPRLMRRARDAVKRTVSERARQFNALRRRALERSLSSIRLAIPKRHRQRVPCTVTSDRAIVSANDRSIHRPSTARGGAIFSHSAADAVRVDKAGTPAASNSHRPPAQPGPGSTD